MKKFKNNWGRYVLQFGVIALIAVFILKVFLGGKPADPEAYCPFGGLQALGTYLNSNSLACSMSALQITMGILLAIGIILFSKLFCGYLCPLGTLTEWLGVAGKKMKLNKEIPTGSVTDKILRSVKYILLFWIFYMTITSSELFCKNLDPYYAIATGFQGEITLWMTLIAITCLILGSLFVKMFWCKYICPLGAISNVFKFTITFVILLVLFLILGYVGLPMPWIWLLGISAILSYAFEIYYYESKMFPLVRVTKEEEKCNHCGLCTQKCPYNIKIQDVKTVKHIDCTLCGECIGSCHQEALHFSHKPIFRWLPAVMVILLFFIGLWVGNRWEMATIDEYWCDPVKRETLQTLEREGMRTVKCYGSSKAFAAKMKHVKGVYGVTTYVKRFAVLVHYDPQETSPEAIEKAMFTPTKRKLNNPPKDVKKLKIVTIGVEKLFDKMDITYLGNFIRQQEGYYGLISEYACPVKIKLFIDVDKQVDEKTLKELIEIKEYEMPVHGGAVVQVKCDYEFVNLFDQVDTIGRQEFLEMMFTPYSTKFEKNIQQYGETAETAVYEMEYPGLDKPLIQRYIPYLSSFLSDKKGIAGLQTALSGDMPVFRILYIKGEQTEEGIWELLQTPIWKIHYTDGSVKEMDAPIAFKNPGKTVE